MLRAARVEEFFYKTLKIPGNYVKITRAEPADIVRARASEFCSNITGVRSLVYPRVKWHTFFFYRIPAS